MEQSISEWISQAAKETQDGVMGNGFMPQLYLQTIDYKIHKTTLSNEFFVTK